MSCAVQKDEVYLNLVLDFVPETVYRVARHFNKAKSIIPIIYVKVIFLLQHLKKASLQHQFETLMYPCCPFLSFWTVGPAYLVLFLCCHLLRCTCTSCFAVWLTSIPRACVTETSSPKTCLWTLKLPSSSCVTLAGELDGLHPYRDQGCNNS